jgi:hypothetical protein
MHYPASLDRDHRFGSIEGLNTWVEDVITALLNAGIDISADGAEQEGVLNTGQRLPSTFGELNGAILMEASGDGNDCLIHSFLTTTCGSFQTLSEIGRIAVARHFRRVVLARLSHFQNIQPFAPEPIFTRNKSGARVQAEETKYNPKTRKYEKTGKPAFRNVSDYLDKRQPLSDEFANRLAEQFNIGILLVQSEDDLPFAQLRNPTRSENMVVIHGTGLHFTPVRLPNMPEHGRPYVINIAVGEQVLNHIDHAFNQNRVELWECPGCHRKNPIERVVCEYCNTRNPAAPANKPAAVSAKPAVSARAAATPSALKVATPAVAKVISTTPWICPTCTFENKASATECEMCGTKKPASSSLTNAAPIPIPRAAPRAIVNSVPILAQNPAPRPASTGVSIAAKERLEGLRKRAKEALQAPTAVTLKTKKNNAAKKENNKSKTKNARTLASLAKLKTILAKRNQREAAKAAESVPNLSKLSLNNNTRKNKSNAEKSNAEKARELQISLKNYYNLMAEQLMHNTKKRNK